MEQFLQEARMVYRATRAGNRFLASFLSGDHHCAQTRQGGLDPLPLGGPASPSAVAYWRALLEYRAGRATEASGVDGAFEVTLEDGEVVTARKLVLATGVSDVLPERPGFRELWGKGVYHCPYCHGWEVRDRPLAVLENPEVAFERVALIRNWSRRLVLLTDGGGGLSAENRKKLDALSVPVYEERISRLEGDPTRREGGLERIVFESGDTLEREGLFYVPPQRQCSELAHNLGCEITAPAPSVELVKADPMTRETTVPGVYSVGDTVAGPGQSVAIASASGAGAAYVLNHALVIQDAKGKITVPAKESELEKGTA